MANEITSDDKLEEASRKKFDQFAEADKQNAGKGFVYHGFLRKLGTEVGLMLKRDKNLPWSGNLGILVSSGLDIVNLSTMSGMGYRADPRIIMAGAGIKMEDILRAYDQKFAGDPKLAGIYAAHATGEVKRAVSGHDKIRLDISESICGKGQWLRKPYLAFMQDVINAATEFALQDKVYVEKVETEGFDTREETRAQMSFCIAQDLAATVHDFYQQNLPRPAAKNPTPKSPE